MNKKISLVLAIVMVASLLCVAMPATTVSAADHAVEIDGVTYTLGDADTYGYWELSRTDITVKVIRDLTQDDFAELGNCFSIYNYETDTEGNPVKVTIDFQGHSLTGITTGNFFRLGAPNKAADQATTLKSDITIKNLNMVQSGDGSFCQIYAGGNYTFENCIFTATNAFAWCGFNANIGGNNGDENPANITMNNVIINMPASGGKNTVTSFIRTGNLEKTIKDEAGKYIGADAAPTVHYVLNNCLFNTTDTITGEDVGNRGVHVTNQNSTVVLNQCTLKTVNACFYPDSALKSFAESCMPGNDRIVANDCILDNSLKNEGFSKADPIYNGQFCSTTDDPLVEDGFQGFEMMTPPETSAAPETSENPDVTTEAPDVTTEAPDVTTEAPDVTTETPNVTTKPTTPAGTTAPAADDEPAEEGCAGCGGFSIAASFLALVCAAGAAIVIKKK